MSDKIVKKKVMNNLPPMKKATFPEKHLTMIKKSPPPKQIVNKEVTKKPFEKPSGNGLELVDINANNKKRRQIVNKK